MEILSKIKKSCLFNYAYYPTIINLIIFTLLLIACAVTNFYAIASTKLTCQFDIINSILASFTYHYSLLSDLIGVGILVYSYYRLPNEINKLRCGMLVGSESSIEACSSIRIKGFEKASIKVYLIISSYTTCLLISLITLFLESTLKYRYSDSLEYPGGLDSAGIILFVLNIIFNTSPVLILHTRVANEVKNFMQKMKNSLRMKMYTL